MDDVSALLDEGTWTLIATRRATDRARRLQERTRELILTYRASRLRAVCGGSDAAEDPRQVRLMRAFAADATVKTWVGPSRGGICILCGVAIKPNEIEYEIVTDTSAMTVEVNCYKAFLQELAEARASNN